MRRGGSAERCVRPSRVRPTRHRNAEAEAAFAQAKAYLSSRDAQQMSESDLERELHRRGQELMRKLLQGHLEQRRTGEATGPVEAADGGARSEQRRHARHLETIFGTVPVERLGYARPGDASLHPLDAALNLPPERYSLEVRRRVAEAAAARSFWTKRCGICLAVAGRWCPSVRRSSWWCARRRTSTRSTRPAREAEGQPPPKGGVVVLTFDSKGVVLHREDLREATRKAAERRRPRRKRSAPGCSSASRRARRSTRSVWRRWPAVYTVRAVRPEPRGVPAELDATAAGRHAPGRAAAPRGETGLGEP